jgi:hypothetical protein
MPTTATDSASRSSVSPRTFCAPHSNTEGVEVGQIAEQAGIVARHPCEQDRRRNVIELHKPGREIFVQAEQSSLAVEKDFVGVLGDEAASALRRALRALVGSRATDD